MTQHEYCQGGLGGFGKQTPSEGLHQDKTRTIKEPINPIYFVDDGLTIDLREIIALKNPTRTRGFLVVFRNGTSTDFSEIDSTAYDRLKTVWAEFSAQE